MGGYDDAYLSKGSLEIGFAYRRLTADQWFVGREVREDKAPFGQPLYLSINSADVTLIYGVTDRFAVSGTIPISHGTHSRLYADGLRHQVSASGIGDVNMMGTLWLMDPRTHAAGNLAVGVGVKAPSGSHDATDDYFVPGGTTRFTVDQSIQLGDGGWGLLLQTQAFRRLFGTGYSYGSGSYLVTPRNETNIVQAPTGRFSTIRVSVPDVFQARAGVGYPVWPSAGLVATLGGRVDGIPKQDLVGGSDGFRRPAILGYVDLGVTLTHRRTSIAVSVPIRAYANFRPSLVDQQLGSAGGGDLAKYLVFASYTRRFSRTTPTARAGRGQGQNED